MPPMPNECAVLRRSPAFRERVGNAAELPDRQTHVLADADMRPQLRLDTRHCRERGDNGKLTALPVQVVAREDRAEQVGFTYSSMAGAKSNSGPFTGAPESFVWLAVPKARSSWPVGTGPGSRPGRPSIPSCFRALTTFISSPSAWRLRGNPVYA